MPTYDHLRVIGSREIYRFFLPENDSPFASSEYLLVPRGRSEINLNSELDTEVLTVVVNPDDYPLDALKSISGSVWLWFLRRLAPPMDGPFRSAPRLFASAQREIQSWFVFLLSIAKHISALILVSDQESEEMCRANGLSVVLSPPPVSCALRRIQRNGNESASIISLGDYASLSSDQRASYAESLAGIRSGQESEGFLLDSSHVVVVGDSVIRGFPYGVAWGFASGRTVISEPLSPRWGLEPGIDYIEFATPEELGHILDHIRKNPMLTSLISERGRLKGSVFEAASNFERILRVD